MAARGGRELFGAGGSELRVGHAEVGLAGGALDEELARLAEEGLQSLLLEGGSTLATSFLRAGLIDKLLVFVAPRLSGSGPHLFGELDVPVPLRRFESRTVGEDMLLSAYVHEP